MRPIAEFIAVLGCSFFTGAAVYVNLVEHSARMECGVELAAAEFAPSYRRASIQQATLAAVGPVSHCSVACRGELPGGRCWSPAPVPRPTSATFLCPIS
jgi:hypothetical protein